MGCGIYHNTGREKIKQVLSEENIFLKEAFLESFLKLLGRICTYEEEEQKIVPSILIGCNLEELYKRYPNRLYTVMFKDTMEGVSFGRIFKAILPLCTNGLYASINVVDDYLEYGILQLFGGPTALKLEELIFEAGLNETNLHAVLFEPYDRNTILIKGTRETKSVISFLFSKDMLSDDDSLRNMAADLDSHNLISNGEKTIRRLYLNFLLEMKREVHGTICIIVDDKFDYLNGRLNGIKLSNPIDMKQTFSNQIESYAEAEQFYKIKDLYYRFMNVDGITILNTKGQLVGYNAFYRSDDTPAEVDGGARKRTFMGLVKEMNNDKSGIVGVFYLSQDGNYEYKRRGED